MNIVERLRELDKKGYQPLTGAIGEEAAAEIERQRNLLRHTRDAMSIARQYPSHEETAAMLLCGIEEVDSLLTTTDAKSFTDYQQRIGAPLTFFTQVAANAYAAAATRDDVSHLDAMRVALQSVEDAILHKTPNV